MITAWSPALTSPTSVSSTVLLTTKLFVPMTTTWADELAAVDPVDPVPLEPVPLEPVPVEPVPVDPVPPEPLPPEETC